MPSPYWRGIHKMSKMSSVASKERLPSAYYGLIYPSSANLRQCKPTVYLFMLQKGAIRAMCSLNRQQSCKEYFKTFKIQKFPSIYILQSLSFIKLNLSSLTIDTFRNHRNLRGLKHSTSFCSKSVLFFWNQTV